MKIIGKIAWISAWFGVTSWVVFFVAGTIPMSEGGMAFIGTAIMLVVYSVPVGIHLFAIWLGLRRCVLWVLPLVAGIWILPAMLMLSLALKPVGPSSSHQQSTGGDAIFGFIGGFFLLQSVVDLLLFGSLLFQRRKSRLQQTQAGDGLKPAPAA